MSPRATSKANYVHRPRRRRVQIKHSLSPFELESALIEHPSIAEAAVVPAPDPMRHTIAKGYVALGSRLRPGS